MTKYEKYSLIIQALGTAALIFEVFFSSKRGLKKAAIPMRLSDVVYLLKEAVRLTFSFSVKILPSAEEFVKSRRIKNFYRSHK